ncbi:MAG: hypothetical protein WC121_08240 [Candidatus Kapaibacterium sp.]
MNYLIIIILFCLFTFASNSQTDTSDSYEYEIQYDTTTKKVFKQAPNATFKVDYFHTDGYSLFDRYWYEIIIIDSSLILTFESPMNDDWNYIKYQKRLILNEDALLRIKIVLSQAKLEQNRKGFPLPEGSGYGAEKLFIETEELNLAGGNVYMCIGEESSIGDEKYEIRIEKEKQETSTISGDLQKVIRVLEELFTDLDYLLQSKDN